MIHVKYEKELVLTSKIKKLDNVRIVDVNPLPAVREHLTPEFYVDQAMSHRVIESSILRLHPDEKLKLDEQDSIMLISTLTSRKIIIELPTKSYVDSLHESKRIDVTYHECLMIKLVNLIITII